LPTPGALDYRSESVTSTLSRIAEHYENLELLLCDIEAKLPANTPENGNPPLRPR
jgi:hypothetical protein